MSSGYRLIGVERDAKTVKGSRKGILTGVLYLAPATVAGREVCPMRTAGCTAACLFTAGRGAMANVMAARVAKTRRFFDDREGFMADLVADIRRLVAEARRRGMKPAVRLNGTSDILWERLPVEIDGKRYPNIMSAFPEVVFYDYTKHLLNKRANRPANYHLTYSWSEHPQAAERAAAWLAAGSPVAVVFRNGLPKEFLGRPVVDGDTDDARFLDGAVVIGLRAKGRAKGDKSGFVVDL